VRWLRGFAVLVLRGRERISRGRRPAGAGLGFLPWSNAVHYNAEPGRRAAFVDAITGGMLPGYGAGESSALHFLGTELSDVVSSRPGACASFVSVDDTGVTQERELEVRYLGEPTTVAVSEPIAA
jgi:dipeptidase E